MCEYANWRIANGSRRLHEDAIGGRPGECRTSILSRLPVIARLDTFDPFTALCASLHTEAGPLLVYATIIGVFGNRQPRFDQDLRGMTGDLARIVTKGPVCIAGDFNVTLAGRPWPGIRARVAVRQAFSQYGMRILTEAIEDTVDHIVIGNAAADLSCAITSWKGEKNLSDHWGHLVEIDFP